MSDEPGKPLGLKIVQAGTTSTLGRRAVAIASVCVCEIALCLCWCPHLRAHDFIVDQSHHHDPSNYRSTNIVGRGPFGQEFAPTFRWLDVVEVRAFPPSALYVNVRERTINGPLLGTSEPGIAAGFGAHFDLREPIALMPDNLYVIEVVPFACSDVCGVTDDSGFQRREEDYYHRGRMIYDGTPVDGLPLNYLTDLMFRTGSTVIPEPATVVLLVGTAGVLCARRRRHFANAERGIVPIASMFGLVASLAAATAASAAPLTFSFTDPAGDASGGARVDVLSLVVNFDNSTGDFQAHVTGRPWCCRSFDRIFLSLFNADIGSTAQDPAFFNDAWSVRWYEPDGTTVVTVTGSDPILRAWNAGDRIATSDAPFGNPDGISEFQSTVRTYLAVEEHRPPRLQGYDEIAPNEFATITPAPTLTSDYNNDGTVDTADYVVWRKNLNGDQEAYDAWRTHFGTSLGPSSGSAGYGHRGSGPGASAAPLPAAVPEPSALALVALALMLLVLRRE